MLQHTGPLVDILVAGRQTALPCFSGVDFEVKKYWDRTLTHPEDLPQEWASEAGDQHIDANSLQSRLQNAPAVMTDFRRVKVGLNILHVM